jgi:hypothetical protein
MAELIKFVWRQLTRMYFIKECKAPSPVTEILKANCNVISAIAKLIYNDNQ